MCVCVLDQCPFQSFCVISSVVSAVHIWFYFCGNTHIYTISLYQQKGRRPVMFGRKMNRPQEQQQLKQEVLDADLDIFAFQSSFDQNFHKAIRVGLHCSPSYDMFSCGYFLLRARVYPCYIFTASKHWTGKQHRSTKNREVI